LTSLIEAHKEYPRACRRKGVEGSCTRSFVVARDGSFKKVNTVSSCGHPFLDEAATRAVASIEKFPPLPDGFEGSEATFTIDITFRLER
jgi:protein TonB